MRRTPALVSSAVLVTLVATALVGCSASSDGCQPAIAPGDASVLVSATGAVGGSTVPTVSVPTPLTTTEPERSVLVKGDGAVASDGMTVDFDAVLFDGATGSQITETFSSDGSLFGTAGGNGALYTALQCARVGDRLSITTPLRDSGLGGLDQYTDDQLAQTVVMVVDIVGVYLGKADGANQLPQDGMPTVVTAVDGTPGLAAGLVSPPAESRSSVIKAGGGAEVAEGDAVVMHVSRWTWASATGDVNQTFTSWGLSPRLQLVSTDAPDVTDDSGATALSSDLVDVLVGSTVGSQLLVVSVPDEGDAQVYVIDVLGIVSDEE
ncbi:hypothetical protein [Homoserinibacter sp. GY 40078]|uniref:hypothetical protein n=1 Tax=Homoserinibacter sp. GY 40078 TaxID=2603275 RepID=UPI0011C9B3D7|nr:hypothetical protein [Homoserinibacter sp. GY 40078]TXK17634.1 hypothetical protein FVQ89_12560 [Homoserinibacter sp. GY 40078]